MALKRTRTTFLLIAAGAAGVAYAGYPVGAQARGYPKYVKRACKSDFKRYCPSYKVGSASLRACMRSVAFDLSRRCVDALERSGERDARMKRRRRR